MDSTSLVMLHPKFEAKSLGGLPLQVELREKIGSVFFKGRVVPVHTKYEHFYKDTTDQAIYPSVTTMLSAINKPHLKQWAVNRGVEYVMDWMKNMPAINKLDMYEVLERSKTAHKTVLDTAALWGNDGHNVVDMYVQDWIKLGYRPPYDILELADADISLEGKCAALGACKFFDEYTLFPILSEEKILSKKHQLGGTLDSLWLIGEVYKGREGRKNCNHQWNQKVKRANITCSKCGRQESLTLILIDLKTSNQITSVEYAYQVSAYSKILTEMCGIKPKLHWILQLNKTRPAYNIGVVENVNDYAKAFLHATALWKHMRDNQEPVKMLKTKKVIVL